MQKPRDVPEEAPGVSSGRPGKSIGGERTAKSKRKRKRRKKATNKEYSKRYRGKVIPRKQTLPQAWKLRATVLKTRRKAAPKRRKEGPNQVRQEATKGALPNSKKKAVYSIKHNNLWSVKRRGGEEQTTG